nr:MAG TPA: hypothetical protein [Bacteriophage sp.]
MYVSCSSSFFLYHNYSNHSNKSLLIQEQDRL